MCEKIATAALNGITVIAYSIAEFSRGYSVQKLVDIAKDGKEVLLDKYFRYI